MNQTSINPESNSISIWIERLTWTLVLLACALSISPNVADPDLWGHVQYGRDVLADGKIPATTSYSYTAEYHRWVNHENLSEIVMAITADTLGPLGLIIGKTLIGMLVIGMMIFINRQNGVGLIANAALALLVSSNLAYHWSIRPQVSSFVCFALLLGLLHICFSGWQGNWHLRFPKKWFAESKSDHANELGYCSSRMRWLWLAVPLFLIWGNSHGGFVAGLCIFAAYMGCRIIEAYSRRGRVGSGIVRRMMLMTTVAILATLVNPYGFKLHAWLLESLGQPRPEILDWKNYQLFTIVGAKFWVLLGVVLFAWLFSKRRLDATQMIVMALVLWQSMSHFRHVPFYALLAGFWVGPHLHSALERLSAGAKNSQLTPVMQRVAVAGLCVAIAVIGFRVFQRLSDVRVEQDKFPVAAIQYMHDHDIRGRIVVTYNWAQYAIAALCVDQQDNSGELPKRISRVAFDGRFRTAYPQSIVDMHFDFLYGDRPIARYRDPQSAEIDPGKVLKYDDPEIVLLSRFGEFSEQNMDAFQDRWVLLYQDSIAQVWGIRRRFDSPENPDYILPSLRVQSDAVQFGSVTWPALPTNRPSHKKTTLVDHQTRR